MKNRIGHIGLLRLIERIGLLGLLALLAPMALIGCSEEQQEPDVQEQNKVEFSIEATASVPAFGSVSDKQGSTRSLSWEPPSGFFLYDNLFTTDEYYTSLTDNSIDAFFARETDDDSDASKTPLHGKLKYFRGKNLWRLVLKEDPPTLSGTVPFYVYGFIPREAADNTSISRLHSDGNPACPNSSDKCKYTEGAVLTLTGLKSVTCDACVIVGAKEGFRTITDTGTQKDTIDYDGGYDDVEGGNTGQYDNGTDTRTNRVVPGGFNFNLKAAIDASGHNTAENILFLLFDHLYSALGFSMKVDYEYNRLRTIKVKKLQLQTYTGPSYTPSTKKTDVTIRLTANNTGVMPFTDSDITYTSNYGGEDDTEGSVFYENANGVALNTSPKTFIGNFVPGDVTRIDLTSTYDVYDKNVTPAFPQGNLIRKECQATNTIYLRYKPDGTDGVFGRYFQGCKRGYKNTINLTIQPTYLYVLSEPDLDNPTVVVDR